MDDLLLWGPPGTGKTTSGLKWIGDRIEEGADLHRLSFVSFTNAAVNEGKARLCQRFEVDPQEIPLCGTLHSLCKRTLGISQKGWLADDQIKHFAAEFGYDLKADRKRQEEDLDQQIQRMGRDAGLLNVWDFTRQRLISDPDAGWRAFARYNPADIVFVPKQRFLGFVEEYEKWKRREGLRDMTDLLWEFVENPTALAVSVAVVDEAQDLSPLMWAAADRLFATADHRGTLGDDDQALFSFSGAAPELLNRRAARHRVKLSHSYRLGEAQVRNARGIIERNKNREPKEFEGAGHAGEVGRIHSLGDVDLASGESWFLQVRNWMLAEPLTEELEFRGIPYAVRGTRMHSPWGSAQRLAAVRALLKLRKQEPVTIADLQSLAKYGHSTRGEEPGFWTWGSKTRLRELATSNSSGCVHWSDLGALGMTAEGIAAVLGPDPFSALTREVSDRDRQAYQAALRAGNLAKPVYCEVSSCHGTKGGECDRSVTVDGCSGNSYRALYDAERIEEERRVAYVAMTRARYGAYVLQSRGGPGHYPWQVLGV